MIRIVKTGDRRIAKFNARPAFPEEAEKAAASALAEIKSRGDAAVMELVAKFEGFSAKSAKALRVDLAKVSEKGIDRKLVKAVKDAHARVLRFSKASLREAWSMKSPRGGSMGEFYSPMDRVGVYIPGGTAPLSSTVLMDVIPAKIAGVGEVILATPPGPDGKINPAILAAAKVAGADRIVKAGGAQAIAALAYGTESVPKADKIVGPGNAFVAEAKRQVYGVVSIDMIAGPSEILIAADGKSNPAYLAADLLSQAEHDKVATAVLVTDSMELAEKVRDELEKQIPQLDRSEIARVSIDNNGKIIVAEDLKTVIDITNEIAPEHLELCLDNPFDWLDSIRHAGSVFLGRNCPEALGDYLAGPNHTLPTQGTAKFSSPLSVDDFVKKTQYTYFTRDALAQVAQDVAAFARKEGLTGHARSATIRTEG